MPYSNVPEDKWPDMEACVTRVMEDHAGEDSFSKENAVAICYSSVMGAQAETIGGIQLSPVTDDDLVRWGHPVIAGENAAELLKARDVVLVRAERNANGDGITTDNIREMSNSLNLKPLDRDHNQSQVIGMFFNPRVRDWVKPDGVVAGGALVADTLIFAGRFPKESAEIQSGERKLSIEARSKQVQCSICGDWLNDASQYCDHLYPLLIGSKLDAKVTRWHRGMTANGGGAVYNPAGTDTTFGRNFVVVAHMGAATGDAAQEHHSGAEQTVEPNTIKEGTVSEQSVMAPSAELDTVRAELSASQATIAALEAEVEQHKTAAQAAMREARREILVSAGMVKEHVDMLLDTLPGLSDGAFGTIVALQKDIAARAATPPASTQPAAVTAASANGPARVAVGDEPATAADPFSILSMEV